MDAIIAPWTASRSELMCIHAFARLCCAFARMSTIFLLANRSSFVQNHSLFETRHTRIQRYKKRMNTFRDYFAEAARLAALAFDLDLVSPLPAVRTELLRYSGSN